MKPHLRLVVRGLWICSGNDVSAFGFTPQSAYANWRYLVHSVHFATHVTPA